MFLERGWNTFNREENARRGVGGELRERSFTECRFAALVVCLNSQLRKRDSFVFRYFSGK